MVYATGSGIRQRERPCRSRSLRDQGNERPRRTGRVDQAHRTSIIFLQVDCSRVDYLTILLPVDIDAAVGAEMKFALHSILARMCEGWVVKLTLGLTWDY